MSAFPLLFQSSSCVEAILAQRALRPAVKLILPPSCRVDARRPAWIGVLSGMLLKSGVFIGSSAIDFLERLLARLAGDPIGIFLFEGLRMLARAGQHPSARICPQAATGCKRKDVTS